MVTLSPYENAILRLKDEGRFKEGQELNSGRGESQDVIITLYLSQFIYYLGEIRTRTKELGFGKNSTKELIAEVLTGPLFRDATDGGKSMAKLMRGKLRLRDEDGDGAPDPPSINMEQVEHVLNDDRYKNVSESCACELAVLAIQSFKCNKVYLYMVDAVSSDTNLMYAIASRERDNETGYSDLFVIFRGSVTVKDWLQNTQAPLVNIDIRSDKHSGKHFLVEQYSYSKIEVEEELANLLKDAIGDTPIKVHRGFLGYLFETDNALQSRKTDEVGKNGLAKRISSKGGVTFRNVDNSKYQSIKNDLLLLFKGKREKLYITGHSLGAALSTLTAFFLACDLEVSDPNLSGGVKCISFASPLVGNISFQRAFDVLQQYQKNKFSQEYPDGVVRLRHLRFTNNRDLIPLLPPLSRYRHTACIHVHLNLLSPFSPFPWNNVRKQEPHGHILDYWDSSDKKRKRHFGLFPPTSSLSGLWATTIPFLWTVFTTLPIILVVFYILLGAVFRTLPSISIFKDFFNVMPSWILEPIEANSAYAMEILPPNAVIGMSWTGWFLLAVWPNSDFKRTTLVCVAAPVIGVVTLYHVNKGYYEYFAQYSEALFVVGMILWQIVLLPLRRADQVASAQTHSLLDYYTHICNNHSLSSSEALVKDTSTLGNKSYTESKKQNEGILLNDDRNTYNTFMKMKA